MVRNVTFETMYTPEILKVSYQVLWAVWI